MREIIGKVKLKEKDNTYNRLNIVIEDLTKQEHYVQVMSKDMAKVKDIKVGQLVRFEVKPVLKKVERREQKLFYNNLILQEAAGV